jgi:hypothetical protein
VDTKLLELHDGTIVEVEVRPGDAQVNAVQGMSKSLDAIRPVLQGVAESVGAIWQDMNRDLEIETAEIVFGLSFEGEGNIFITRASTTANLTITLKLAPRGAKK